MEILPLASPPLGGVKAFLIWLQGFLVAIGYPGAFLAGLLGSSSLFIAAFPSFLVVPVLATVLQPTVVGIVAGIGAGVGQFLHYYIGIGGRHFLSERRRQSLDGWRKRIERYGVVLVFVFAATPLTPDDAVWIPLGIMRYPRLKALLAGIAGKVVLNLLYAYAGVYGWGLVQRLLG